MWGASVFYEEKENLSNMLKYLWTCVGKVQANEDVDGDVLDFPPVSEALQSEGQADTPGRTRPPISIQVHQMLLFLFYCYLLLFSVVAIIYSF